MSTRQWKKEIEERLNKIKKSGESVNDYLWDLLGKYDEDEKQENDDDNDNDEKSENKKIKQTEPEISPLIDFENANQMCDRGHSMIRAKLVKVEDVCNACGSSKSVRGCYGCCSNDVYETGGGKKYLWCFRCRKTNTDKLKIKWDKNENKRQIIRNILFANPSLELDVLCALPRAAALHNTLEEIVKLDPAKRKYYVLYLIDLDNFKALNSALGHDGADKVVIDIAAILKKYQKDVNADKWNGELDSGQAAQLKRMFLYRQGGDEFAIILEIFGKAQRQRPFYESWKKEINALGNKYLNNLNDKNESKAIETFKERKLKQIFAEMEGLQISNDVKSEIKEAIKKQKTNLSLDKIGISVGMYVVDTGCPRKQTVEDWLKGAESAQDEVKRLAGKNDIRICYVDQKGPKVLNGNSFWEGW